MAWVPKPQIPGLPEVLTDPADIPRRLTVEEIRDIASALPPVLAADRTTSLFATEDLAARLAEDLRDVEIAPSALPEYKEEILREYQTSRVSPGQPVGVTAAESIGGPASQMSLNSFHVSGSSTNVSYGVDALKELLFARKNRKRENCSVHFKNKHLTYEEVLLKRSEIVGLLVSDVLSNYDLDGPNDLPRYWWHEVYPLLMKKRIPRCDKILRLYLNVDIMYEMRVTMEELARAITKDTPASVTCIHGPLADGIMDIYPDENLLGETLRQRDYFPGNMASQVFLKCIVLPLFDKIKIKGVSGIRRMFPVPSTVWSVILEERRPTTVELAGLNLSPDLQAQAGNLWYLFFNKPRVRLSSIGLDNIRQLLHVAGIQAIGVATVTPPTYIMETSVCGAPPEFSAVFMPDYLLVLNPPAAGQKKPGQYIQSLLEEEANVEKKIEREQKQAALARGERIIGTITHPPTALMQASQYWYADTDGSNLVELLARDDVDETHTICNNIHEIAATLGIEACGNVFCYELYNVIKNAEAYVNPRHIELLRDFITGRGVPLGVTFSGISRQPVGHLSLATFERTMDTFTEAAAFGKVEDLRSVSGGIIAGKRVFIGTGVMDVNIDEAKIKEYQERMRALEAANPAGGAQITEENIAAGMDELENINLAMGTFDQTAGENGGDLLDIFNQGEIMPNFGTRVEVPPPAVVYNGDTQEMPALRGGTKAALVIPQPLLEALNKLTAGLPNKPEAGPAMAIRALTTGIRGLEGVPGVAGTGMLKVSDFAGLEVEETGLGLPEELIDFMGGVEVAPAVKLEVPQVPERAAAVPLTRPVLAPFARVPLVARAGAPAPPPPTPTVVLPAVDLPPLGEINLVAAPVVPQGEQPVGMIDLSAFRRVQGYAP